MKVTVECPDCGSVDVVEVNVQPGQQPPEVISQPHLICPDE